MGETKQVSVLLSFVLGSSAGGGSRGSLFSGGFPASFCSAECSSLWVNVKMSTWLSACFGDTLHLLPSSAFQPGQGRGARMQKANPLLLLPPPIPSTNKSLWLHLARPWEILLIEHWGSYSICASE